MNCQQFKQSLIDSPSNRTASLTGHQSEHVASCQLCRSLWDEEQAFDLVISQWKISPELSGCASRFGPVPHFALAELRVIQKPVKSTNAWLSVGLALSVGLMMMWGLYQVPTRTVNVASTPPLPTDQVRKAIEEALFATQNVPAQTSHRFAELVSSWPSTALTPFVETNSDSSNEEESTLDWQLFSTSWHRVSGEFSSAFRFVGDCLPSSQEATAPQTEYRRDFDRQYSA